MKHTVTDLTPDVVAPLLNEGDAAKLVWLLPATNPAVMIPAIGEDGSFYPIEKIEAHVRGIHHQAFSIFVFCEGRLLLQQRAAEKYHCPGQWANTCCSHPHFGETASHAAARRLQEELGFQVPLKERMIADYRADVGNGLWENERVHFFRAEVEANSISFQPNPEEVQAVTWASPSELRMLIEKNPGDYAPWLKIYLSHFPDLDF